MGLGRGILDPSPGRCQGEVKNVIGSSQYLFFTKEYLCGGVMTLLKYKLIFAYSGLVDSSNNLIYFY
jgi:hypothetical protein